MYVYSKSPLAVHVDLPAGFGVLGLFCAGARYTRVASLGLMVMLWKRFSIYSLSKYFP